MNMNKHVYKYYSIFIALVFVFFSLTNTALADMPPFEVSAKSAILMDYGTGEILYEKNPHEKLPIASLTKIMTLLLALESIDQGKLKLEDKVVVSEHAASMGGSQVFLHEGEVLTVDAIMKAIIVASGNDASVALAEKIAGTHEVFVKKMNEKAQALGMKNTNFVNATGLPAENSYSTAYDVAIMSRELLNHPLFFRWSTIWVDTLEESRNKTELANTNRLVRFYSGADGIKTGSTSEAGYCLSATAKRGNMRLLSIVLGAPTSKVRFSEAAKLMDYGFANYKSLQILKKDEVVQQDIEIMGGKVNKINGIAGKDVTLLLKADQSDEFEKVITIEEKLKAPISKGDKIGSIFLIQEGKKLLSVDILADRDVQKANVFDYFIKILNKWIRR